MYKDYQVHLKYGREYQRKKRELDPIGFAKRQRATQLRIRYGMTHDDYNHLFESQKGCCAICLQHQSSFKRPLVVDHNHNTNKVRGLLCDICNSILGYSKDNPVRLKSAISYLNKYDL